MRTHLQAINWSELLNVEDIDKAWSVLMDTVKKAENIFVPLKTIKTGTSKKKFFPLDQDVLDLIKTKTDYLASYHGTRQRIYELSTEG